MKKLQIGVIGSMGDIPFNNSHKTLAANLGMHIAKNNLILLFGFEDDFKSLSLIAAENAIKHNGQTVAFIKGTNKTFTDTLPSTTIITGQERGGGREFSFILSCDVVISIHGGSGTLMEITMAYQADIPVIVIKQTGGWSQNVEHVFLDERKRQKIHVAKTAEDAVRKAIMLTHNKK